MKTKLDSCYRIIIPTAVRKELNLTKGSEININVKNNSIILTNEKMQSEIDFLRERENKLQLIEQMFQSGTVDLDKLYKIIKK